MTLWDCDPSVTSPSMTKQNTSVATKSLRGMTLSDGKVEKVAN